MVQFNPSNPFIPKNVEVPQQQQQASRAQSHDGAAQRVSHHLQSNPALLKSVSDKFRIDAARENSATSALGALGATRASEGAGESSEIGAQSNVRLQDKAEVGPRIKKTNRGNLQAVDRIAPSLGEAASSPEISGGVGEKCGVKGHRKGAGLLGAAVAKGMTTNAGGEASAPKEVDPLKPKSGMFKAPAALFRNNVHQPKFVGSAPAPRSGARASGPSLADLGKKRLSEALEQGAGGIGDFLRRSPVGAMLRAVEELPGALAKGAQERLQAERYFLRF